MVQVHHLGVSQRTEVNTPQRCLHRQVHSCTHDSYIVESTQVSIN